MWSLFILFLIVLVGFLAVLYFGSVGIIGGVSIIRVEFINLA